MDAPCSGLLVFLELFLVLATKKPPDIIQSFDLLSGIEQLYDLSIHRMNEGKIFQLLLMSVIGWLCVSKERSIQPFSSQLS